MTLIAGCVGWVVQTCGAIYQLGDCLLPNSQHTVLCSWFCWEWGTAMFCIYMQSWWFCGKCNLSVPCVSLWCHRGGSAFLLCICHTSYVASWDFQCNIQLWLNLLLPFFVKIVSCSNIAAMHLFLVQVLVVIMSTTSGSVLLLSRKTCLL